MSLDWLRGRDGSGGACMEAVGGRICCSMEAVIRTPDTAGHVHLLRVLDGLPALCLQLSVHTGLERARQAQAAFF